MRRSDDTADKLRNRLLNFHKQTAPVIDYYERSGKVENIDAKQDKNVSITCHLYFCIDRCRILLSYVCARVFSIYFFYLIYRLSVVL